MSRHIRDTTHTHQHARTHTHTPLNLGSVGGALGGFGLTGGFGGGLVTVPMNSYPSYSDSLLGEWGPPMRGRGVSLHTYIYVYCVLCMCVCVCVRACVRACVCMLALSQLL